MAMRGLAAGVAAAAVGLGMLAGAGGCALSERSGRTASKTPSTQEALSPVLDAKARIPFDRLEPLPALPAGVGSADRPLEGQALKHYQVGLDFAKVDQLSEAMEAFEAAAKADPRAYEPRLELGRAALQSGLFDQAHDALDVAVSLRPDDSRAHYLLGLLNYLRENDKAAMPQLRYALALYGRDGDRIQPLFYLAQILERQGYHQAAVDAASQFESLLASHPARRYEDARWQQVVASQAWKIPAVRASCLRKLGKPSKAVAAYDAALKLDPDRPEVQLALAETLIDVGDTARAVKLAEAVLARDRHNGNALAILAATLAAEGRMAELQDRLLSMVRAKPSDLLLAQRSATIFLKFGRYDAALETLLLAYDAADDPADLRGALLQVVFANPDFESAQQLLAKLLKQVGPNEAESLLGLRGAMQVSPGLRNGPLASESLLARAGSDRAQLLALAVLTEMTDRPVLSEQALRRVLQDDPDNETVAMMMAERLVDQCRWQDLIAFVKPQIEKHKDTAAFYRLLGMAYDGLDDFRSAMNQFYEALRRDKRDVQSMWMAAQINDRLGQMEPAVSIYQVIVAAKPDFWPANLALVRGYLQLGQQKAAVVHARKLKELFADVSAVELCVLIAQTGKPVPRVEKIAALLAQHQDDPVLLQAAGEAYLQEGWLAQAVEALNRLLSLQPDDEDGRLLLATALSRQMEYDLSGEVVRSLLAEHPNRRSWQLAEAELLLQAGRPAEAVPILERILAKSADAEQKQVILDRLIFAWGYAGRYDAALDFLGRQLKESPRDRALQTRLLSVLVSADRREEAIDHLRRWRQVEPDEPLLARLEAQLLLTQGAGQAAEVLALQGWSKEPVSSAATQADRPADGAVGEGQETSARASDSSRPSRDIAVLTGLLSEEDAAAWLANRAWLGQTDVTAAALAAVAGKQARPLEATELQRLTGSTDVEDLAQRAQWLFLAGQRAQAELLLMPQIERQNPELFARIKRATATHYKQFGLERLAMAAAEEVQASDKDAGQAIGYANDLAYMWAESGVNLPQAEDLGRMAVAGEPTNAAYLDTLGWVYYKMGRFEEALRLLQRAIAVPTEGSDPVLYDHLGDALWRTGGREQAAKAWRRSVELYQEEIRADSQRPDLQKEMQVVERKIQSVEANRQPAVATSAGRKAKRPG